MRSRPVKKLMRFCIEVFRQVMIRLFQAENTVFTSRSSNLSLTMSFTDLDKDRACHERFEYVARYFENSLDKLKSAMLG